MYLICYLLVFLFWGGCAADEVVEPSRDGAKIPMAVEPNEVTSRLANQRVKDFQSYIALSRGGNASRNVDYITVEETKQGIESSLNYYYSTPTVQFKETQLDSVVVTVQKTGELVSPSAAAAAYNQAYSALSSSFSGISDQYKSFVVSDVEVKDQGLSDGTAELKMYAVYSKGTVTTTTPDGWYYGQRLGSCTGALQGIWDASLELTYQINTSIGYPNIPLWFEDVEIKGVGKHNTLNLDFDDFSYFDVFPNPQDIIAGDNSRDYLTFHADGPNYWSFSCINGPDMQYYQNAAINVLTQLCPPNKAFIKSQFYWDLAPSGNFSELGHTAYFWYGTPVESDCGDCGEIF